jgi:hypothetical protein
MSNCIQIGGKGTVTLAAGSFNVEGLRALVDAVRDLPTAPTDDGYIAWWFLTASVFTDRSVRIKFGRGRSSHTYRDFRATLWLLAKFALEPIELRFKLLDRENPREGWGTYRCCLNTDGTVTEVE